MHRFYIRYRGEDKIHHWLAFSVEHLIYIFRQLECNHYVIYKDKKGTIELHRVDP